MSQEVTHIVAEVENSIHSQVSLLLRFTDNNLFSDLHCDTFTCCQKRHPKAEVKAKEKHGETIQQQYLLFIFYVLMCVNQELQDMVRQYTQAVPVQKDWLDSCFSKQRKVNTDPFLHLLR